MKQNDMKVYYWFRSELWKARIIRSYLTAQNYFCANFILNYTRKHTLLGPRTPTKPVVIIGNGKGAAIYANDKNTEFWYIDRWSSTFSWGCRDGSCKPEAGDIVVIPEVNFISVNRWIVFSGYHGVEISNPEDFNEKIILGIFFKIRLQIWKNSGHGDNNTEI